MKIFKENKDNLSVTPPEESFYELQDYRLTEAFGANTAIRFRNFVIRYLELFFVFLIALLVCAVFFIFPYKYAFLNLFYLPVLLAAYILGKRKAFYACLNIILLVIVSYLIRPEWFATSGTFYSTLIMIVIWGGFLILTSAGIGSLQERLSKGFEETRRLYEELNEAASRRK
jgi:hypothetical protein